MRRLGLVLGAAVVAIGFAVSATAEFRIYPGAQRDPQLEQSVNQDPNNRGSESEVYFTSDPLQKVYEFYKGIGTEDQTMKKVPAPKLPDGRAIEWAFFTFDDQKSISRSKLWAKIQRPTVVDRAFKDIRDVTSIQLVRKK